MKGRWKQFFLCAGSVFTLMLLVLLWLGPVWIHDVEDHLLAVFGSLFLILLWMALLAGAPVADAAGVAATATMEAAAQVGATATEVAVHGGSFLHRLARGAWPAVLGVVTGSLTALLLMWILAHASPLRMVYARARPARALATDFVRVAKFLDDYKKAHGTPPRDALVFGRSMEEAKVSLRYSTLREGVWRDPWARPFRYEAKKGFLNWKVRVYSLGPNGQDDGEKPDDISIRETLAIWKFSGVVADSFEKYIDGMSR